MLNKIKSYAVMCFIACCMMIGPANAQYLCGDGTCSSSETYLTCPADCQAPGPKTDCGNGYCGRSENFETCPADCLAADCNKDGQCESHETAQTCPDCAQGAGGGNQGGGAGGTSCGNGRCERGESFINCTIDCAR